MKDFIHEIYEGVVRHRASEAHRGYLGMSAVGNECWRAPWHQWRQTTGKETDGRVLLLFETGKKIEEILCRALRIAGVALERAYPDPQLSFTDFGGFFSGHPDGIIQDESGKMILEIKSANTNKFKTIQADGVAAVYPIYYRQAQLYMGYAGLPRCLFLVMRKDDSTIYAETITFEESAYLALKMKAARILETHDATGRIYVPDKISEDPACQECRWCAYTGACHEQKEHIQTIRSCRSCAYFLLEEDWRPWCRYPNQHVEIVNIDRCCPQWAWVLVAPF